MIETKNIKSIGVDAMCLECREAPLKGAHELALEDAQDEHAAAELS
jgi:hypothetical protein